MLHKLFHPMITNVMFNPFHSGYWYNNSVDQDEMPRNFIMVCTLCKDKTQFSRTKIHYLTVILTDNFLRNKNGQFHTFCTKQYQFVWENQSE